MKKNISTKGYALYTAIILTGVLILVAYATADLAIKESSLSSAASDSHVAFYNADSGLECALYADLKNGATSNFDENTPGTVSCNGQTITTNSQMVQTNPTQLSVVGDTGGGSLLNIGFDSASNGNYSAGGTDTWPHTTSGIARILFVGVQGDTTDLMTGCTYAGQAMTLLKKTDPTSGGANDWLYMYYLLAPANGTNDVVCTSSGQMVGMSASYTGVSQIGAPSPVVTNTKLADSGYQHWYTTLTTTANNAWAIEFAGTDDIYGYGSLPSIERSRSVFATDALLDTGGPVSVPSAVSIDAMGESGTAMTSIMTSFVPAASSGSGSNGSSIFQLNFPLGCAIVTVTKSGGGTLIQSHGYNSCTGSNRLERGIEEQY